MTTILDHPLIRASTICPLCIGSKDTGLLVCWPCYRSENLRNGNAAADAKIDYEEARLAGQRGRAAPRLLRPVLALKPGWRGRAAENR